MFDDKKIMFFWSWIIKLLFNVSFVLITGILSPVKGDSSTFRFSHVIILESAGTISPASKNIISPGTKVLVSAISILPFLFTLQVEASYFFSPSITEFAFSSWIKPVIAFIKTTTNITIVSVYSWE